MIAPDLKLVERLLANTSEDHFVTRIRKRFESEPGQARVIFGYWKIDRRSEENAKKTARKTVKYLDPVAVFRGDEDVPRWAALRCYWAAVSVWGG